MHQQLQGLKVCESSLKIKKSDLFVIYFQAFII